MVIKEGECDGRLFIIVSGEVEVIKNLGKKNERRLNILGPNRYFGEMA
ncbi:MAG: cyclic nucleotide-binding domain-containing protein [Desulfobacterales bacterium]|nr:MAG: cyclic nucleotide-binding domain-containing protein [Desulfobacterales bacterium]